MITISNLSKNFIVYRHRLSVVKQLFGIARQSKDIDIVASLKGINLTIPSGEVHGIIGMNGAGKSTLLKLLTGVIVPTSGSFTMNGRVASLLELGTGFHGELTGRANVYMNGAMIGLTREEIESKIAGIEEFSELGDFFDRPVKIYSSGMYVRLAFAFAVSVDPDVLIIDEALSVGDAYFQQKCLKKIREFKERGTTILFVSHDLAAVKMLCDRVTMLAKGEVVYTGEPLQAMDLYNALLADFRATNASQKMKEAFAANAFGDSFQSGTRQIEVLKTRLESTTSSDALAMTTGERVKIVISTRVNQGPLVNPTCGILIRDRMGYDIFGTNTFHLPVGEFTFQTGQLVDFEYEMDMNLGVGDYSLAVSLHSGSDHIENNYHWVERAKLFQILPCAEYPFIGVTRLNVEIRCLPRN